MAYSIPYDEPDTLRAGDNLQFYKTLPDFLPADGWTLKYNLRGKSIIDFTAGTNGADHYVNVTAATTRDWQPGAYSLRGYVTDGTNIYTVITGMIEITDDFVDVNETFDPRSHAKRTLELIESALEGRIPNGMENYSIAGRQISKIPIKDLRQLYDKYKQDVIMEDQAAKIAKGLNSGRNILARFVSP